MHAKCRRAGGSARSAVSAEECLPRRVDRADEAPSLPTRRRGGRIEGLTQRARRQGGAGIQQGNPREESPRVESRARLRPSWAPSCDAAPRGPPHCFPSRAGTQKRLLSAPQPAMANVLENTSALKTTVLQAGT